MYYFLLQLGVQAVKSADSNFSSEKIPENLNLLKVDYDTYTDLKKQY
jgi:hypothetical protein